MDTITQLITEGRPARRPCIVGRWRLELDEDNRDVFDALVDRARHGEVSVLSLWRGLRRQGLPCAREALRLYIIGESPQPHELEA